MRGPGVYVLLLNGTQNSYKKYKKFMNLKLSNRPKTTLNIRFYYIIMSSPQEIFERLWQQQAAYANCEATRLSKRDNTKHHNGKENRKLLFAQLSLIVVDGATIA